MGIVAAGWDPNENEAFNYFDPSATSYAVGGYNVAVGAFTGLNGVPTVTDAATFGNFFNALLAKSDEIDADGVTVDISAFKALAVGGDGGDTFTVNATTADIYGGNGDDVLSAQADTALLDGAAGDDLLTGGSGADLFQGGGDDDTIVAGPGDDTIQGGDGVDVVTFAEASSGVDVTLSLGIYGYAAAPDDVHDISGIEAVTGSDFDDRFSGTTAGLEVFDGGAGDDVVVFSDDSGEDSFLGGEGLDVIDFRQSLAGASVNFSSGAVSTGPAVLHVESVEGAFGSAYSDLLIGGNADELFTGGGDTDNLYGGSGDDTLEGGGGDDTLIGADGSDTLRFDSSALSEGMLIDLDSGSVTTIEGGTDTFASLENVAGYERADTISGTADANLLEGLGGADILSGRDGYDLLYGGKGNDTLDGGAGNDRLDGGDGRDTVSYAGAFVGVEVNLAGRVQTYAEGVDRLFSIEAVIGSDWDDALSGSAGADTLSGGRGDDIIRGGLGDDKLIGGDGLDALSYADIAGGVAINLAVRAAQNTGAGGVDTVSGFETVIGGAGADSLSGDRLDNALFGGKGNDVVAGGAGDDTIDGGVGDDQITGGEGQDTMTGGGGRDTYIFYGIRDSTRNHADRIGDLNHNDTLDLSAIDADVNADGDQAFVLADAFTKGVAGQAVLSYDPDSHRTTLSLDVNGDRKADMVIVLDDDQTDFDGFVL